MTFENMRLEKIRTFVHYKPDKLSWNAHSRKDHIIGISISGTCYHDLGYKKLNLEPGYIYFFNQRDDFSALVKEAGYCYSIHFTTTEPIETDSFCKKVNNTEEILKMIKKVERAWMGKETNELPMLSEFYSLCDTFRKINTSYVKKDMRIFAAKEYIDIHFKEKGCLSEAIALSGLTQRRFNDVFNLHFNSPPSKYINSKKLESAKELLKLSYLTVADVAEMSGFSDVYYFSRFFKQKTGISPVLYKRGDHNEKIDG